GPLARAAARGWAVFLLPPGQCWRTRVRAQQPGRADHRLVELRHSSTGVNQAVCELLTESWAVAVQSVGEKKDEWLLKPFVSLRSTQGVSNEKREEQLTMNAKMTVRYASGREEDFEVEIFGAGSAEFRLKDFVKDPT